MRALKSLLWLCLLMVGLQCCLPAAAQAAGLQPADELSLRIEDPAAPEEQHGLFQDGALYHALASGLLAPSTTVGNRLYAVDDHCVPGSIHLLTGGVQPSAP